MGCGTFPRESQSGLFSSSFYTGPFIPPICSKSHLYPPLYSTPLFLLVSPSHEHLVKRPLTLDSLERASHAQISSFFDSTPLCQAGGASDIHFRKLTNNRVGNDDKKKREKAKLVQEIRSKKSKKKTKKNQSAVDYIVCYRFLFCQSPELTLLIIYFDFILKANNANDVPRSMRIRTLERHKYLRRRDTGDN